jgi:hypothetical protein
MGRDATAMHKEDSRGKRDDAITVTSRLRKENLKGLCSEGPRSVLNEFDQVQDRLQAQARRSSTF